jgi:hypothetical protein
VTDRAIDTTLIRKVSDGKRKCRKAKSSLLVVQNDVVQREAGVYPKMVVINKR